MKIRSEYPQDEVTTEGGFCLTPEKLMPFKKRKKPALPQIDSKKPNTQKQTPNTRAGGAR